ncbi:hypothetical protein [Bradyrhizobium sp.]|uniref:hypothetical protein n=1 Tax=Bradyrhizobium sp. TaxID=376 RepID=UPI0023897454|nr:hypothetical protein [Bradyrhizobium sp.]MDE2380205.1 hypothetical protein [Bradyrhizobium sp.]
MSIREDDRNIVLLATVTLCCIAVAGAAALVEPAQTQARDKSVTAERQIVAAEPSAVRVVGTPFVPNVNPRER